MNSYELRELLRLQRIYNGRRVELMDLLRAREVTIEISDSDMLVKGSVTMKVMLLLGKIAKEYGFDAITAPLEGSGPGSGFRFVKGSKDDEV